MNDLEPKPSTLLLRKGRNRPDDFQTPEWPVEALIKAVNLSKNDIVWEPACGKGNIVSTLTNNGYVAFGTDITDGADFFTYQPDQKFDVIITNPPYSLKDRFLDRCYQLHRPFALLLPLTALEGIKRQKMYRDNGIQIIFLPRRVNFETPSGQGKGSWFATAWFTWGFDLPSDIVFLEK